MPNRRISKNYNPGDILEMIVDSQARPLDDQVLAEEEDIARKEEIRNPIISVNGRDVEWSELGRAQRKDTHDKAA